MAGPADLARSSPGNQRRMSHTSFTSSSNPSTPRPTVALESATAWNASVSQPRYSPQFSATTSHILDRIRSDSRSFNSALSDASAGLAISDRGAYENARLKVVKGMNMSTAFGMPQSPQQQQQTTLSNTAEKRLLPQVKSEPRQMEEMNAGVKRKREAEQPPDFTQNTMVMPPTKPMPVRNPPQQPGPDPYGKRRVDPSRQQKIERYRQKRLASFPEGVVPHKPELVGFGSNQASDYARAEYFGNMKKTDVLNLLSFCDQLRPDLLLDLMVSVTKRHPDLPIFSSPDWDANIQEPARPPAHRIKPKPGGPRHGPSLLNSKAKHKIKSRPSRPSNVKKPHKRSRLAIEVNPDEEEEAAEQEEYYEEDTMPTTWPKPGEGMYAKLPPETEDNEFLVDGNDEEAFSHFMVDGMGRQIVEPV